MKRRMKAAAALGAAALMTLSGTFTGFAQTGWVQNGNAWNYYNGNGEQAKNQWVISSGAWFWIEPDGTMATNKWVNNGDNWYWVDGSGATVTGWHEIGGKWYFFYKDFTMAKDTTIDSYYVGEDGAWTEK